MSPRVARFASLVFLSAFALGACGGSEGDDVNVEEEVQSNLDAFPEGFTKINLDRVPMSAHGDTYVDIWVTDADADEYRSVVPMPESGSGVSMGQGAMVIKEMFDIDGNRLRGTVLYKAPAGYDETFGDWFRAEIDADFQVGMSGKIGYCYDCHEGRGDDDYLWGIESDNQM